MRNISAMDIIQIDVTNICDRTCSNCTRLCGHYRPDKLYFMDIDYYEKAITTLDAYQGIIGMIGGEPTLHPRFPELCEILRARVKQKERRGLWSNVGPKYHQYKELIEDTFGFQNLNDHVSNDIIHTPILVASQDLIRDGYLSEQQWRDYTDSCWVQNTWSATITPSGAYFCEVAGMLDYLFEGNVGWDIFETQDWWKKTVSEYEDQIGWACKKCGCQLPLQPRRSEDIIDDVSDTNLQRLVSVGSPKIIKKQYNIYSAGFDMSQVRDNTWYWNSNNYMANFRRYIHRVFGK